MFEVAGVFAGALVSGLLAGRVARTVEKGPRVSRGTRLAFAFAGGALMAVGAALARGCTSGQALTGGSLLNLGSWVFMLCLFAGAYAVAPLFRKAVAMSAPFYPQGAFSDEASLALALAIGIGFGFFLERAGFGSARKLVSQFYLDDLAVFKVMFTAIVTAMLGLWLLSGVGFLDLSLVSLVPTYWIAQVVGGLVLGVGFVVGGYCPGTSIVSTATFRLDGLVYLARLRGGDARLRARVPAPAGALHRGRARAPRRCPRSWGSPTPPSCSASWLMALAGFRGASRRRERRSVRPGRAARRSAGTDPRRGPPPAPRRAWPRSRGRRSAPRRPGPVPPRGRPSPRPFRRR